jgi:hypothetical protein
MKKKEKIKEKWEDRIYKIREYSSGEFDRLIVYISSGGLVLTISFKDVLNILESSHKFFILSAWIFFVAALLAILISHKTSIISMDLELDDESEKSDRMDKKTGLFNWFATISLFLGIISFLIYLIKNIL